MNTGISWFPAEWAGEFYVIKGVVALVGTLMLIWHMASTWDETRGWGQRLRYITLLCCAAVFTFSSVEQTNQDTVVNYRNVGALMCVVLLVVTMVVSIREYLRDHPNDGSST